MINSGLFYVMIKLKGSIKLNDTKGKILLALVIAFAIFSIVGTYLMFNASLIDDKQGNEETSSISRQTTSPFETGVTPNNSEIPVTVYNNVPVVVPNIETQNFNYLIEAEDTAIYGGLYYSNTREGYSGTGYVTGFDKVSGNRILFYVYIPTLQHYDITIRYASDAKTTNSVKVDGEKVGILETDGQNKSFKETTIDGVFLKNGYVEIEIVEEDGNLDIDYIEVNNNTYVYETENDVRKTLSNENASDEAKELMSYLVDMYGNAIIRSEERRVGKEC